MSFITLDMLENCLDDNIEEFDAEAVKKTFFTKVHDYLKKTKRRKCFDRQQVVRCISLIYTAKNAIKENPSFIPNGEQEQIMKKFDIFETPEGHKLILKRKNEDGPIIQYVAVEDSFEVIADAHLKLNHARHKTLRKHLRHKYVMNNKLVLYFVNACNVCQVKRKFQELSIRPPLSTNRQCNNTFVPFNKNWFVFVIDMTLQPDDLFHYILITRDSITGFTQIRPMMTTNAAEVAVELFKIFTDFGPPLKLLVNNVHYFEGVRGIMLNIFPGFHKIVIHRLGESLQIWANQIQLLLAEWIQTVGSNNWAVGCFMIQWIINNTIENKKLQTPFYNLFGCSYPNSLSCLPQREKSNSDSANVIHLDDISDNGVEICDDSNVPNTKNKHPQEQQIHPTVDSENSETVTTMSLHANPTTSFNVTSNQNTRDPADEQLKTSLLPSTSNSYEENIEKTLLPHSEKSNSDSTNVINLANISDDRVEIYDSNVPNTKTKHPQEQQIHPTVASENSETVTTLSSHANPTTSFNVTGNQNTRDPADEQLKTSLLPSTSNSYEENIEKTLLPHSEKSNSDSTNVINLDNISDDRVEILYDSNVPNTKTKHLQEQQIHPTVASENSETTTISSHANPSTSFNVTVAQNTRDPADEQLNTSLLPSTSNSYEENIEKTLQFNNAKISLVSIELSDSETESDYDFKEKVKCNTCKKYSSKKYFCDRCGEMVHRTCSQNLTIKNKLTLVCLRCISQIKRKIKALKAIK